jgi:hypothetical protein
VLVDGTKVAAETLAARPGEFFDKEYPLTSDLTRGKSQVTVRFESAGTQTTATVFDVRTVRRPD